MQVLNVSTSTHHLPKFQHVHGPQTFIRPIFMTYLWLAMGGALGTVSRYWLDGFVTNKLGDIFPWGTLIINVLGSFIIGFFATLTDPLDKMVVSENTRLFVMIGLCGGFTTFSAFSLQTLNLVRTGEVLHAGIYVILSVSLCLLFVWLGHITARF